MFGEVAGLQVGDLDLERHRISIKRQAVTVGNEVHVKEALKTESSRREVAFSSKFDDELTALCEGKKKTDFLFTKQGTKEPLKRPQGTKLWLGCAVGRIQAVDEDFPHVTSHDLRHTAISLKVSVGAPISVISRQVGHKNISMTLDHYTELFDSDLDSLTAAMDSIL
nr:site-specific integrase [Corynebacterium jeddahense]